LGRASSTDAGETATGDTISTIGDHGMRLGVEISTVILERARVNTGET